MKLTMLTVVEIILFNFTLVLAYQPKFMFKLLNIEADTEKKLRLIMTGLATIFVCVLFCWSFLFGSMLFLYKQALLYN